MRALWKIQPGAKFHNGKGDIREVVEIVEGDGSAKTRKVRWQSHDGDSVGRMTWAGFVRFAKDEWFESRPDRLPVPVVLDVELAFPTGAHTPPWRWVPDEFRDRPGGGYVNDQNPWCRCINALLFHRRPWSEWQAIPKKGVDPEMAHRVLVETMGSFHIKVEKKIATMAYMMSEWFEDYWWKGDTHSQVHKHKLSEWIEGWPG